MYPQDNEEFELTAEEPIEGMDLVEGCERPHPEFVFDGKPLEAGVGRFKLVQIRFESDDPMVDFESYGEISQGQWLMLLRREFAPQGQGIIETFDLSWISSRGSGSQGSEKRFSPYLDRYGRLHLTAMRYPSSASRWLMKVG